MNINTATQMAQGYATSTFITRAAYEAQSSTIRLTPRANVAPISDVLAHILVLAGNIAAEELSALTHASQVMQVPLGRILVMCRRLNDEELHTTLKAARLVQTSKLSCVEAAILIAYCLHHRLSIDTIWQRRGFRQANLVTLLLVTSGRLATSQLERFCAERAASKGRKIQGSDLYKAGLISLEQWQDTLKTAMQIKESVLPAKVVLCDDPVITGQHPVYVEKSLPTVIEQESVLLEAFEESLSVATVH